MKVIEGSLRNKQYQFAIVASRFNRLVVGHLVEGAVDFLKRHGVLDNNICLVNVPGAFEIPKVARQLALSEKYDGVICLGALIRGETAHFELIAAEVTKGLAQINNEAKTSVSFGILTTDSIEQALERAGTKKGNKGSEAAEACLEMVNVMQLISV